MLKEESIIKQILQNAPIYSNLERHMQKGIYPFHMPGHKQGQGLLFGSDFLKMDITEIPGMDNLHYPEGIINQAENLMAETFGAEKSYFLINGSSSGLEAAILAVCGDGDKIITARNCHRSVYQGLILSGAEPVYLQPEVINGYGLLGGIAVDKLIQVLEANPEAKAVILTSPTYEGFTSDVASIAAAVHSFGMVLIIDEAHGAHFHFHEAFPKTALEQGADLVVQSIHKTLPSFTQTAVLHVGSFKRVNKKRLSEAISSLQTTSPSYLMMAGLDVCRSFLDQAGKKAFSLYYGRLQKIRKCFGQLQSLKLLGGELCGNNAIAEVDFGKLVFISNRAQLTGGMLEELLCSRYHIQAEYSRGDMLLCMTSVADTEEGFKRLCRGILSIDKSYTTTAEAKKEQRIVVWKNYPVIGMRPRQAFFSEKKILPLEAAVGRICGEFIIPYPPGIPLIIPGEVLTEQVWQQLQCYRMESIPLVGPEDRDLKKITVIV